MDALKIFLLDILMDPLGFKMVHHQIDVENLNVLQKSLAGGEKIEQKLNHAINLSLNFLDKYK